MREPIKKIEDQEEMIIDDQGLSDDNENEFHDEALYKNTKKRNDRVISKKKNKY